MCQADADVLFAKFFEIKERAQLAWERASYQARHVRTHPMSEMRLQLFKHELREAEWLIDEMVKEYSRVMDGLDQCTIVSGNP